MLPTVIALEITSSSPVTLGTSLSAGPRPAAKTTEAGDENFLLADVSYRSLLCVLEFIKSE